MMRYPFFYVYPETGSGSRIRLMHAHIGTMRKDKFIRGHITWERKDTSAGNVEMKTKNTIGQCIL